ncbi:uncharacterized protein JCM6883_004926 [Sporobolomyces salmoneus]|uniref:uncharacterized protein n=1 Tax=Sporobolomyces salmoneus TaxID=183962 RepID=UPI003177E6E0
MDVDYYLNVAVWKSLDDSGPGSDQEDEEEIAMMVTDANGDLALSPEWQKKITAGKRYLDKRVAELEQSLGQDKMIELYRPYEYSAARLHPGDFVVNTSRPQGLRLSMYSTWFSRSCPPYMCDPCDKAKWISYLGVLYCDLYDQVKSLQSQLDEFAVHQPPQEWCLKLDLSLLRQSFAPMNQAPKGTPIVYILAVPHPITGELSCYVGSTQDGRKRLKGHKALAINGTMQVLFSEPEFDKTKLLNFELFRLTTYAAGDLMFVVEHIVNVLGKFTSPECHGGFSGINHRILDLVSTSSTIDCQILEELWLGAKEFSKQNPEFKLPRERIDWTAPSFGLSNFYASVDPQRKLDLRTLVSFLKGDAAGAAAVALQLEYPLPAHFFPERRVPRVLRPVQEVEEEAHSRKQFQAFVARAGSRGKVLKSAERAAQGTRREADREARRSLVGAPDEVRRLAAIAQAAAPSFASPTLLPSSDTSSAQHPEVNAGHGRSPPSKKPKGNLLAPSRAPQPPRATPRANGKRPDLNAIFGSLKKSGK